MNPTLLERECARRELAQSVPWRAPTDEFAVRAALERVGPIVQWHAPRADPDEPRQTAFTPRKRRDDP